MRTRDILILVAAGVAGALAELIQLWLLLLSIKHFHVGDIASTSLPLILGDAIGIAVVTPLVLRGVLHHKQSEAVSRSAAIEFALLVVLILVVMLFVVRPPSSQDPNLFYILFLPVAIAAVRYGIDGACAALAVSQLGLVAFLHWHGFDLSRFTEYQMLMLVLTLTGLLVGGLVSERQSAHREAEATRQRLQELEAQSARQARLNLASDMAAALAHEINQPMTAARALARSVQELMRAPNGDQPRIERNVAGMIEQIDHAGAVVSRMREFLRRGEPHFSTLEMRLVIHEALALVEPLVKSRKIKLDVEVSASLASVHGDHVQIQQVIINLVKNSVEAIAEAGIPDGRITIAARNAEQGRTVEVSITDNGPGIERDQGEAVFEPLNTSRREGIGLGLSTCRTIIRAHGGGIWLSASLPGQTEFRFSLPSGEPVRAQA